MPTSFDNEITHTSSGTSQPNKTGQKGSSAGVQIPTKNSKKNGSAKDGGGTGGVMAAVTRSNAAKSSKNKSSAMTSQTPSPETKPVASTQNECSVTSPMLDALSSTSQGSSVTHNTNEWAKNIPAFSSSPNNLIGLGESPPTLPSSYEDKLTNYNYSAKEDRGSPNNHIPSTSSPINTISRRRPLSYQLDGSLPYSPEEYHSTLAYAARRTSMYSQQSQAPRYGTYPPLPHQPQAHFHGAPDANLMLSPRTSGLVPGEKGFYCGFDSYPAQDITKPPNNVIVTGFEGGLSIFNVSKRGLNKMLTLGGLRGGVYNTKILPWTAPPEQSFQYPLIAVVVHGPVRTISDRSSAEHTLPSESPPAPIDEDGRISPRLHTHSVDADNDDDLIEYYQTTVEVYSLSTRKHIATLLSTPKTHLPIPPSSPLFTPPAPVGSFTIRADRGNVIVASGITGETWIFRQRHSSVTKVEIKCIGKVWTTVQHGLSVDPAAFNNLAEGGRQSEASPRSQYKASILSLNGRWLAYCPSAATSQISLRATVPETLAMGRIPGLNSQAPPHLPAVNCLVDTPGGEGMLKQVLQAATQGIVEISGYVGKQGAQYWNNYWNKSTSPQQTNGGNGYAAPQNISPQFPPTHGLNSQANTTSKDPGLISILDLDSLTQQTSGSSIHPLATFPVPHGCSFLSLAPSGLALFTASSKGDVQFVWDLMRLHYPRSSLLKAASQSGGVHGPHVRQIAQFSRMTIARIVDVVWTAPHGERAAMVTEPGTVHILDLPASAFTWPPPRRRVHPGSSDQANPDTNAALSAVGVASSAVSSLWTVARPLVGSRKRRSSVSIPGITAASVKSQAGQGTQALAAGISRSVGAATGKMNEMRKSGGTKLHLPKSGTIPNPNCVRFYNGKHGDSIILVGGGIVRIYTVKSRRADRPADRQKASRGAKYVEYQIPSLPDVKIARCPIPDGAAETLARDAGDNWKARQVSTRILPPSGTESSIPQAEIESNAPYQPFHTDRRVSLHVYSHEKATPSSSSVSTTGSSDDTVTKPAKNAWAFGGTIKIVRLDVGPPQLTEDDYETSSYHRALPSSAIERVMRIADSSHEDMEQIVVTTRRRKGVSHTSATGPGDEDEEGFFEDDCEVLDFASQRV